jgi:ABC-type glycerol-3-phosphate transport system substrate-binding protein
LLAGRADYDLVYLPASRLPRWVGYHALQPVFEPSTIVNAQPARTLQPWLTNLSYADKAYGFPTQPAIEGLWYRVDLLAAAGLQPPTTWEAFRDTALALTQAPERYGAALAAGENGPGAEFWAVLAGFGGQVFKPPSGGSPEWEVNFDQPEAQQALEYYAALWAGPALAPPDALSTGRAGALNALQTGRAAMAILPLTAAAVLFDCKASPAVCTSSEQGTPASQLAFAALPGLPAGQAVGELGAWVIPLHATHPQAAHDFGAWLVGPQGARAWALHGGIPAAQDLLADPQVADQAPYLAILDGVQAYRLPYPPVRTAEQVDVALQAGVQAAAAGRLDVPSAAAETVIQLRRALQQGGYPVK